MSLQFSLIYQFADFVKAQCPTIASNVYAEGRETSDMQNNVLIREGSGVYQAFPSNRTDCTIQVVVSHRNRVTAKTWADLIYDAMRKNYNFQLPAGTEAATGVQALDVKRMEALQAPYGLGTNAKQQAQYVNNYILTFADPPANYL